MARAAFLQPWSPRQAPAVRPVAPRDVRALGLERGPAREDPQQTPVPVRCAGAWRPTRTWPRANQFAPLPGGWSQSRSTRRPGGTRPVRTQPACRVPPLRTLIYWCSWNARCVAPDAAFRTSRAVAGARAAVRLLLLTALARRGPACARAHGPWSHSAGDVGSQTVSAASRAGPPPRAGDRRPQEEAQRCGLRPGALGASQGRRRRARWSSGPCASPPRPRPSPRGVQAAPAGGQRAPGSFLGDVSAADARGSSRDRRLRAEAGRARTASSCPADRPCWI